MVEMTKWDLHAAEFALKNRRATSVRARVVGRLAGRPSLLHAGWMVQRLGLTVSIPGPLTCVHAVFPAARHRVASHPGVRHLIHVCHAVVHCGEPQQSTIKKSVVKKLKQKKKKKYWVDIKPCDAIVRNLLVKNKAPSQRATQGSHTKFSPPNPQTTDYTEQMPHPPPPGRIGKQRFMTRKSSNLCSTNPQSVTDSGDVTD